MTVNWEKKDEADNYEIWNDRISGVKEGAPRILNKSYRAGIGRHRPNYPPNTLRPSVHPFITLSLHYTKKTVRTQTPMSSGHPGQFVDPYFQEGREETPTATSQCLHSSTVTLSCCRDCVVNRQGGLRREAWESPALLAWS
jgi:hypothetical protein